jgi:TRAP-type mannitol/chloroaromatic compound transport system permease small subunit
MKEILRGVRRGVGWLNIAFAAAGGLGIIALTLLSIVNVAIRNTAGGGIDNAVGYGEVGMAAIALLGASYAQRQRAHIRSTVLLDRLGRRARDFAELTWLVIITGILAWVVHATSQRALLSIDISESRFGTVPIWPARVLIALSLALLTLELALQTIEQLLIIFGAKHNGEASGEGRAEISDTAGTVL